MSCFKLSKLSVGEDIPNDMHSSNEANDAFYNENEKKYYLVLSYFIYNFIYNKINIIYLARVLSKRVIYDLQLLNHIL